MVVHQWRILYYKVVVYSTFFMTCWTQPLVAWMSPCTTKIQRRNSNYLCTLINDNAQDYYYPATTSKASILEKAGSVLYRKSVFSPTELMTIRSEVERHSKILQEESSSSIAQKRLGATLSSDCAVLELLKHGSLHALVEKATGTSCVLSSNLPVEIRSYEREGAGMAWHVDDILYDPPQIEIVFTLQNDSDCQTMWKEVGTNKLHVVETEPNSAILLLAGGSSHCVTHLKRGKRMILKCAYVEKGAVFREGQHENQFESKQKRRKKSGRRR